MSILPLLPYSFLGHLFEYHQRVGYIGVFICLNMGGSYRRGCRISRLEDQCKQRVGGLENEVGKGGGERTHSLFMFAGGNAEGSVTLFMTQLSLSVRRVTGACAFRL